MNGFVRFEKVEKIYKSGEVEVRALHDVSFEIGKGEIIASLQVNREQEKPRCSIYSGVWTALHPAAVYLGDKKISDYNAKKLAEYRRHDIGFVFQFYNLIPNLTALENVEISTQLSKDPLDAKTVLKQVGLEERTNNFPAQLSGGEQQRVAIARALAKNPSLMLCDEPTGALDYQTGKSILKLLQDMSREKGMTVVIITHNSALTAMADRIIRIKNGTVLSTELNNHIIPVENIEW